MSVRVRGAALLLCCGVWLYVSQCVSVCVCVDGSRDAVMAPGMSGYIVWMLLYPDYSSVSV